MENIIVGHICLKNRFLPPRFIVLRTALGGDTRDIAEPTYKGFNQLLDTNPIAYKGFNQLQGFQPTTKVSTNLLEKIPTAY